jgi:hypothetical protein
VRRGHLQTRGIGGGFAAEWRRVPAIRGAFIPLVVTPLVYRAFYPQPCLNQIMRKIPIAIVDNDLSELSRRIVQTLDASGAVKVVVRADTLPQARVSLDRPALARAQIAAIKPFLRGAHRAQGHVRSRLTSSAKESSVPGWTQTATKLGPTPQLRGHFGPARFAFLLAAPRLS